MVENNQFWTVALSYGALQGLLLFLVPLFMRRGRRLANILLSAMMLWSTIHITHSLLIATGLNVKVPWVLYLSVFLNPTVGPLYYFYTKSLLSPEYKPNILLAAVVILVPGLLWVGRLIYLPFGLEERALWLVMMRDGQPAPLRLVDLRIPSLLVLYLGTFLILTWRHIRNIKQEFTTHFAGEAERYIVWLRILGSGLGLFVIVLAARLAVGAIVLEYPIEELYFSSLLRSLIIQFTAISVFFLPDAFFRDLGELTSRRRRLVIDDDAATEYLERLQEYMTSSKPYRVEDLRLGDLADRIGVPAHTLSQLINDRLNTNFSDYINQYRVNDAQEMLLRKDNDKYTFVALAREAGFHSKASFYRAFKKHTGMSPSEYKSIARQTGAATAN